MDSFEFIHTDWFKTLRLIIGLPSIVCLLIHLCKFFRSKSPQRLATKNLTVYCFILLINNFFNISDTWTYLRDLLYEFFVLGNFGVMRFIYLYSVFVTTFFKFIIAIELYLCFRKVALYLQRSSGTRNRTFIICVISGVSIPLGVTILLYFLEDPIMSAYKFLAMIRVVRLIPVVGAFCYIRSASIHRNDLFTKFALQLRLLLMIGGISAALSLVEVIIMNFVFEGDEDRELEIGHDIFIIHNMGTALEGLLIGILFTFRKNTFKPVNVSLNRC